MDILLHGKKYENIPDEVVRYMERQEAAIIDLHDSIRTFRMKSITAREHPTKATKLQKWEAMKAMYAIVPEMDYSQKELF